MSRRPSAPSGTSRRRVPSSAPSSRQRPAKPPLLSVVPPLNATYAAGWALLVLRAFLGFTFCFAGLQKLANKNFFNSSSPASIQAQLYAYERTSPIHFVLGHLVHFAGIVGLLIAVGELAVGIGTLLGLWTRIAALGGMALSFALFLSVSFHSHPFYTGSDIVFLFAWTPLLIAGSGGVLSLDALLEGRARRERGLPPNPIIPVEFDVIRQACGTFKEGRCAARRGALCEPSPCPYLAKLQRAPVVKRAARPGEIDRRTLVLKGVAVGAAGAAGIVVAGVAAGMGRAMGGPATSANTTARLSRPKPTTPTTGTSPSTTQAPSTTAPAGGAASGAKPSGTAVGPASDVPVGGAASFTDPGSGDPALVLQSQRGHFVAFDAVCPHAGCTVQYSPANRLIVCPCHGSEFNADTGAVEVGPAATGLTKISVALGGDGNLYVSS
jgi:thiosulfate dehydrogenase [quinone] large subunit